MSSGETALPACERFTVLESRPNESLTRCDVCNHLESGHPTPGRRSLSGGEVEALRKRMIIDQYEKFEEARRHGKGNGESQSSQ